MPSVSTRILALLILVVVVLPLTAARSRAGAEQVTKDDLKSLLSRAEQVVVADVLSLSISGRVREYNVKVTETLKGKASATIVLRLPLRGRPSLVFNYFEQETGTAERAWHFSPDFWLGRTAPYIELDGEVDRYIRKGRALIFVDELYHVKGFEPIYHQDDPWYLTVKAMIANSAAQGRPMDAIEFLKMFPAVYVAQCGHLNAGALRPGRIWGGKAQYADATQPDYPKPHPCEARKGESFLYLSLFFELHDLYPMSVPIENGVIKFAERYGDIVIANREVAAVDAIKILARAGEKSN